MWNDFVVDMNIEKISHCEQIISELSISIVARLNGSQLDNAEEHGANEFKIDETGNVSTKAGGSKRCGLVIDGKFHVNLCLFRKFRKRRELDYEELRGRFEWRKESENCRRG